MATAHPAKFSDVVMKETSIKPDLPENLKKILNQKEKVETIPNDLNKVNHSFLWSIVVPIKVQSSKISFSFLFE